jgi:hypothetical protein
MKGKQIWVISGLVYLVLVIAVYSWATGANPFQSGQLHGEHAGDHPGENHDHSYSSEQEQNEHEDHDHEKGTGHDHGEHHHGHGADRAGESEVKVNVLYEQGVIQITLEDDQGHIPGLLVTHEELMHLILVSSDLEEYIHLHPVEVAPGRFEADIVLKDGHYYAFVDILPEAKQYVVEAQTVHVGHSDHTHGAALTPDQSWVKTIQGKEAELRAGNLFTGQDVSFTFDLKGETPLPYLGALGHVVIIDEKVEHFIHVHPQSADSTVFEAHFSQPGIYKLWAEFKFADTGLLVFPFVLEVKEG